ncbi:hypothetical protein Vretifemale_16119 [Volvox reticuliferus]|uniref:Uncharacterized protein n=1 Tax=Volvox reticuliferus TaxID=1737510 RepID=A0A8J4CWT7_9CHLO|nr:hypothetical protein Vretifemale_16119 [Volvox reticuliferus]
MSVAATQQLVVVYEGKKRRHGDSQAGSPTSPPRSTGTSAFKRFVVVRDQLGRAEGPRRGTEGRCVVYRMLGSGGRNSALVKIDGQPAAIAAGEGCLLAACTVRVGRCSTALWRTEAAVVEALEAATCDSGRDRLLQDGEEQRAYASNGACFGCRDRNSRMDRSPWV